MYVKCVASPPLVSRLLPTLLLLLLLLLGCCAQTANGTLHARYIVSCLRCETYNYVEDDHCYEPDATCDHAELCYKKRIPIKGGGFRELRGCAYVDEMGQHGPELRPGCYPLQGYAVGVECYCNDADMCNAAAASDTASLMLLAPLLLLLLLTRR